MRALNEATGKLPSPQRAPAEAREERRSLDLRPDIQRQRDGAGIARLEGRTDPPLLGGAAGPPLLL